MNRKAVIIPTAGPITVVDLPDHALTFIADTLGDMIVPLRFPGNATMFAAHPHTTRQQPVNNLATDLAHDNEVIHTWEVVRGPVVVIGHPDNEMRWQGAPAWCIRLADTLRAV